MLGYCQLDPSEQTSIKPLIEMQNLSFLENVSEDIVCEMAAILSRGVGGLKGEG